MNGDHRAFIAYAAANDHQRELLDLADCTPIEGTNLVLVETFAEFTGRSRRQAQAVLRTLVDRGDIQRVSLTKSGIVAGDKSMWGYRLATQKDPTTNV